MQGAPRRAIAEALDLPYRTRNLPPEACGVVIPAWLSFEPASEAQAKLARRLPRDRQVRPAWAANVFRAASFQDDAFTLWVAEQAPQNFIASRLQLELLFAFRFFSLRQDLVGGFLIDRTWRRDFGWARADQYGRAWLRDLLRLARGPPFQAMSQILEPDTWRGPGSPRCSPGARWRPRDGSCRTAWGGRDPKSFDGVDLCFMSMVDAATPTISASLQRRPVIRWTRFLVLPVSHRFGPLWTWSQTGSLSACLYIFLVSRSRRSIRASGGASGHLTAQRSASARSSPKRSISSRYNHWSRRRNVDRARCERKRDKLGLPRRVSDTAPVPGESQPSNRVIAP